MKLESFYNSLVKEITASEGVTAGDSGEKSISTYMENRKEVLELSQKFLSKTNFYNSYVSRTIMEIILAVGLLVYLGVAGIPTVLAVSINIPK